MRANERPSLVSLAECSKVQLSHSHYVISKSAVVFAAAVCSLKRKPREIVRHDQFNNKNINEPLIMHFTQLSALGDF